LLSTFYSHILAIQRTLRDYGSLDDLCRTLHVTIDRVVHRNASIQLSNDIDSYVEMYSKD
jgi:hypothetical protein